MNKRAICRCILRNTYVYLKTAQDTLNELCSIFLKRYIFISIYTELIFIDQHIHFYFNKRKSEIKRYVDNECNIEPIMKTFECVFRKKTKCKIINFF